MGKRFTLAEDEFLCRHINQCYTLHSLVDMFNAEFPEHQIKYSNLGKRLEKLGVKKGTHNIRKGEMPSKNPIETVIFGSQEGAYPADGAGGGNHPGADHFGNGAGKPHYSPGSEPLQPL